MIRAPNEVTGATTGGPPLNSALVRAIRELDWAGHRQSWPGKSARGLAQSKSWRQYQRSRPLASLPNDGWLGAQLRISARSWTALVLWRFGVFSESGSEVAIRSLGLAGDINVDQRKAPEDWRSPKAGASISAPDHSLRSGAGRNPLHPNKAIDRSGREPETFGHS